MSRSRKKFGGVLKKSKYGKIQANKKVRKSKNLANGGAYRKVSERWKIYDQKYIIYTKQENLYKYYIK